MPPARHRPHWQALFERLCTGQGARDGAPRTRAHPPPDRRERRHLQCLRGSEGRRSALGARSAAADSRASRSGAQIEAGVAQRARVLDALLADLYGPQRLIAEGLVPPELPFGHPNFLWPCHGIAPRGAHLAAPLRGGSGARARRPLVGAGGSHAGALGCGLCAGEPRDHRAGAAGSASAIWMCGASRGFFGALRDSLRNLVDAAEIRWPSCSRPGPSTRPISNTPISRASWVSRSPKAAISRCATTRCI